MSRAGYGLLRVAALPAALLVTLLWRLPSLADPPWVNDEGTYFAVAGAMAHGYRLYGDVWENKPPGLYLVYAAVYHVLGPSLLTVRLLATLAVLCVVALVYRIARAWGTTTLAALAGLLAGLLLGVPFLEGTTANAEVFVVLLTSGAVSLLVPWRRGDGAQELQGYPRRLAPVSRRGAAGMRAFIGGLSMGFGVLFKAVAAFDAMALGLWLVFSHRRRDSAVYAAGVAVPLLGAIALAAAAGVLRPMIDDALLYPLGYVGHGNGGGFPWGLGFKVAALLALTVLLRRAPFPFLWLAYSGAGALLSGRMFGHYALQVVPALSLTVAWLLRSRPGATRWCAAALPAACLLGSSVSALVGWSLAATGHDSILARRLQWYANAARMATGMESYATYQRQFDDAVQRNRRVARLVRAGPAGPILVWANTPWVYVLSGRQPATPYTSADRAPLVPGETATLRRAVRSGRPAQVVIVWPPDPALGAARTYLRQRYREVARVGNATVYASRR